MNAQTWLQRRKEDQREARRLMVVARRVRDGRQEWPGHYGTLVSFALGLRLSAHRCAREAAGHFPK